MNKCLALSLLLVASNAIAMDYCRVTVPDKHGATVGEDGKYDNDSFGASIYVGDSKKVSRYDLNPADGSIMDGEKNIYHYNDDEGHSFTLNWDGLTVESIQFIPDTKRFLMIQQYMPDTTAKSHNIKSSASVQAGSWHDCSSKTIQAIYKYDEENKSPYSNY